MFERFTERARQAIVLAQEEARALKHTYIGTEHILLGLLSEGEGEAALVLESISVTYEEARDAVLRIAGLGDEGGMKQLPFTPRAKRILELALREALALGHNYIGTEHLLLAIVRENEGVAAKILLDMEATPDKVRNEVIRRSAEKAAEKAAEKKSAFSEDTKADIEASIAAAKLKSFRPEPSSPQDEFYKAAAELAKELTLYVKDLRK
jgi:ATP-dependent Clp protease ATP-binding subunit ClpC